ncbi:MAG: DUF452 family protein [Muribaculaceae bacterium]|nr:DUF452 family protein [Muribaculaceae bacterium]
MKIEFIKRGAATRLILLFAGWSTDSRYYSDCIVDGWDTAVVSDYRDMSFPDIPEQYSTIYIFAYSLGVWAASKCNLKAAARVAICGSGLPVSDYMGIPVSVFDATADGLTAESLIKFHRRMAGNRATIARISPLLPCSPDVKALQEELYAIAADKNSIESECKWDRAYIAVNDRIFPVENLERYWNCHFETVKVKINSSHAADISQIIKEVIPNTDAIGAGFSSATRTYNGKAIVQREICVEIGGIISRELAGRNHNIWSLLEIGVGQGMLTEVWQKLLNPTYATFVDLLPTPKFGVVDEEEYILADAEEWLKDTSAKFDVILSASTIQWFADPVGFIQTVKDHLNPGGFAVISTFVKGNLHQLDAVRPCPLIYHTADEYKEIPDVTVEEREQTLTFSSPREMLMHLRHTGVSPRRSSSSVPLTSLPTELTYRPLILIIHSPHN